MKKITFLAIMFVLSSVASYAADVSTEVLKQFTAPCELKNLTPEQARIDLTNEMKDYINQGFKLVSLTKVSFTPSTCIYTFVRQ